MRKLFHLLLLIAFTARGEDAWREITFCVRDEENRTASGVTVIVRGLDRDALGADTDGPDSGKHRGWTYRTGTTGRFTARFGKFRQYDHEQATGLVEPGYGHFYFVVEKENSAGGVSPEILNLNEEEMAEREKHKDDPVSPPGEGEEWKDEFVLTNEKPAEPVEILLKRGLELTGQMVDTAGRPVRGEEVNVFNDLHADSHTGRGGEIFEQQTHTDRAGRFHFHHVYPNVFYVQLLNRSEGPPYWIKTRVRDRWVDRVEDEITPRQDEWKPENYEKAIDMRIIVAREPPYRYFGRITDAKGEPVPGAKVQIRCSLHEPERTFEDDHDFWWTTKTDRDGRYSVRVGSRFVNAIWVTAGKLTGTDNAREGELMAPGRYDIAVRPKKPGSDGESRTRINPRRPWLRVVSAASTSQARSARAFPAAVRAGRTGFCRPPTGSPARGSPDTRASGPGCAPIRSRKARSPCPGKIPRRPDRGRNTWS